MQGEQFHVTLTGVRTREQEEAVLRTQLQERFHLRPEQVAPLLQGRRIVKRGVDKSTAQALVKIFAELGLEAVVESSVQPAPDQPALPQPRAPQPARAGRVSAQPLPAQAPAITIAGKNPLEALVALGSQRLPRPRTGALYIGGLLLVTLVCITIPVLYMALTAAIAYGWFWFLTHYHQFMPRNIYAIIFGYAVPGVMGAVLVVFLLRPLFLRRGKPPENVILDPASEAGFIAGVHALCRAIGVSPPREIALTWDANASVRYRTRWLSLVTGHKVLTIGMSLAGGLTARQFIGVLAHEFGHFAQRAGMACSFIVNSVNAWLEHRAYGHDSWEQKLQEWVDGHEGDENAVSGVMMTSAVVTLFAISLIRRLMRALFHLSLRVTGYMSRQMEFDADRYEALLAGSAMFRTTARSLRALVHSFHEVNSANIAAWREGRLLRDLPDAVATYAGEFDARRLAAIDAEMDDNTTTRYWDSHPPDIERVQNAENQRAAGIFLSEAPATSLFADFGAWSRRVTQLFYREQEVEYGPEHLCPRDEVLGRMRADNNRSEQIGRYFNGQFRMWPVLRIAPGATAGSPGWQQCIDEIRRQSPDIAKVWNQASEAQERRGQLLAALRLQVTSRVLGIRGPDRSPAEMETELGNIAGGRMDYAKPLAAAHALYARRMAHAIEKMPDASRERASSLVTVLQGLADLAPLAAELDQVAGAMRCFAAIAENNEGRFPGGIELLEKTFSEGAAQLLRKAGGVPQTLVAGNTVGGYLRSRCHELGGIEVGTAAHARATWPVPGAFGALYIQALGDLVQLCTEAEQANGIRPIRVM